MPPSLHPRGGDDSFFYPLAATPADAQKIRMEGKGIVEFTMPDIDLDQMTDVLWDQMRGRVDRPVIRQALQEALAGFHDARVWTFVPILIQRSVLEQFQKGDR